MATKIEMVELTDEQFCKWHSEYHGGKIDKVDQLIRDVYTGEELREFIEFCINKRRKEDAKP